ncbi:Spy/CpxP family protein refolding chaperone [Geopsychrobacter electrodiphilus]|uniref:Spy/CpxP family protein refolding chaperone n=1 Tax=Geopsychrobacter electrodiphilus TaxID=225196 RepID=UPI000367CF48|nr:hypothetical protein [Geopsychrobacter electrodiphilus]
MKRVFFTAILVSFFIGTTALSSMAAAEHQDHRPCGMQPSATATPGMMGQQGKGQMPCMAEQSSCSKTKKRGMMGMMGDGMGGMMGAGMGKMMGAGKMGMMQQRMVHMFYLDRAEELGLSPEQVGKLKALHSECRKDNIRNAAEAKIARMDLADLLDSDNWSLKDAEPLVRKVQKLEGDIQVRHLQAISAARKVLTAEQLKQSLAEHTPDDPESLFQ